MLHLLTAQFLFYYGTENNNDVEKVLKDGVCVCKCDLSPARVYFYESEC